MTGKIKKSVPFESGSSKRKTKTGSGGVLEYWSTGVMDHGHYSFSTLQYSIHLILKTLSEIELDF